MHSRISKGFKRSGNQYQPSPLHEDKNVGLYKETDFENIEHFRVIAIVIVKSVCIWLKIYHFSSIYSHEVINLPSILLYF